MAEAHLHPAVAERLARLAPDQRAAATAPPGPVLCVAPAGSGKTTTLVARVAWLVATGVDPGTIAIVAFNKRAAEELAERLGAALEPLGVAPGTVRVRTFHALGREILRDAGVDVEPLADRAALLRELLPDAPRAELGRLDLAISRLKLDLGVTAEQVARDPDAGPVARAFVAYERARAATGGLDFDDLVRGALEALEGDEDLLARWRGRCAHLLVDEAQDVDRTQLRLVLLLAAPADRVFLVGDDDQTIYGWRLADVRRVLGLAAALPGLRRVDLTVNYRCPRPVVERAVRLVELNRERFAKRIAPRPVAPGRIVLAPDPADEPDRIRRVLASWPDDGGTRAILARTNRELLPAAAIALEMGIPFRAPGLALLVEDPRLASLLELARGLDGVPDGPPVLRLGRLRRALASGEVAMPPTAAVPGGPANASDVHELADDPDAPTLDDLAAALLGWAPRHPALAALADAVRTAGERLAALRRDDAPFSLATAHGTKGLEFDHVAVLADGFPARRAVVEAVEPERALEEERRLAYVAWTRARRTLTLVFDPASPSRFLVEAFDPTELGIDRAAA